MLTTLKSDRGIALVVAIFISSILLTLIGGGLLFSGLELKIASALKTGTGALYVADAGIQHALAVIPAGTTFSYSTDPNNPTEVVPNTPYPTNASPYNYRVTAISTNGGTQAILTSTAQGPNSAKKVVVAYIGWGSFGLGSISSAGPTPPNTLTNFSGTSFSIDGNDNCNSAPAVPGIVVTDSALATSITNATTSDGGLASNQMGLVTGTGGAPSVSTITPLSQKVSQIADAYLSPPLTHVDLAAGNYSGTGSWGTSTTPQITQVTGDAQITGNITGYGVLIVNGTLDVAGNFTFNGLVIARGGNVSVQVTGNAGIYGSLLIAPPTASGSTVLDVRGNAHIGYNSCALASADGWKPLPKKAKLLAWQEKFV